MRVLLPLLLVAAAAAASLENIPTDSWMYDDLDLLKTSALIRSMPSTSRPWTRAEAVSLVREADSTAGTKRLGAAQCAALSRLRTEFSAEVSEFQARPEARRPLIRIPVDEGRGASARADLFTRPMLANDRQSVSAGAVLSNRPGDVFAFYERAEFTMFRPKQQDITDSAGTHLAGSRVHSWMGVGRFEIEQAYLAFKIPWLRLELGRDEFSWGPGYVSSCMLSDHAPSLDHIQLQARYRDFKFLAFTAALSRWGEKHRFLSGQRLEVSMFRRLTLGGALMAVYSWDSLQTRDFFGMMNPLMPIYLTLANSGHDDNLLVGWDAVLYLPQTKVYGLLFVDNYEFVEKESKPCNALAYQVGAYWQPDWPVSARLEYARVNPFTYYHRIYHIMYDNYGVPLGHELGPDADQVYAGIRYTVTEPLVVGLVGSHTRRGYYNRGDFERKTWHGGDSLPTNFPAAGNGEKVEVTSKAGLEAELWLGRDLRATGSAGLWRQTNSAGVPGQNRNGLDVSLGLEYRY